MSALRREAPLQPDHTATLPRPQRAAPRRLAGFSLLEAATVLVIVGLLLQALMVGQQLIQNARVRHIVSQQAAVEAAFEAFQDRYRQPPGDFDAASTAIDCGAAPCLNGNGDGRIEAGTNGAPHEEILAWQHLVYSGFLQGQSQITGSSASMPTPENTPHNIFGGYLEISYDSQWGYSGNPSPRHNIKTGNHVPAAVLVEVDRKIDDGMPGTGELQFSTYAADGASPPVGGAANGCTDADSPAASWQALSTFDNCGAATLVR